MSQTLGSLLISKLLQQCVTLVSIREVQGTISTEQRAKHILKGRSEMIS